MNQRVYGLEGMRGIAAFWVYTHHFLLIFFPVFYFGEHTWINHILNPDLAVSWFFVHSGYVLAFKSRNQKPYEFKLTLIDQSLRRYLRLVPPVLFSIFLTWLVLKLEWIYSNEYALEVKSSWLSRYLHFKPNIFEALKQSFFGVYFDFKSSTTYNPSLWTIGYELISSYILFGCLALFGRLKHAAWIFLFLGFAVTSWKGLMCFMIGAFLSRIPPHRAHWGFLTLLTVTGFYFSDLTGTYADYARNLGSGMLMYVLLQAPNFRKVLNLPPFKILGDISYSLYALHFLILVSLTSFLGIHFKAHESTMMVVGVYCISTSVLLVSSYLMWKFVDAPGIEFAKKISSLLMHKPTRRTIP